MNAETLSASTLGAALRAGAEWAAYQLLRCLAHRRERATEEQLDAAASRVAEHDVAHGVRKAHKLIGRFKGRMPTDPGLSYLDVGCGDGHLTIALGQLGLRKVTGIDFLARNIQQASALAGKQGLSQRIKFVCADVHSWEPPQRYDVLLSFDAMEHVDEPKAFLERMKAFIAPGGIAVLAFGPLFHSPFGDHMWGFFRVQVPWRGLIFPEKAMLRARREFFRPTDPATRYREIAGGLNLMRYSGFLRMVEETGWEFEWLAVNTFLERFPPLQRLSNAVMRMPLAQDYFPHNVYCILRLRTPKP